MKNNANLKLADASLFLDPTRREVEPHQGAIGCSIARVKGIDAGTRSVTALVSTPNPDRYEEIVEPKAFEQWLDVFMTNPVFCAGHTYVGWAGEPTVIGHWTSIKVTQEGLEATCEFARTELAEQYWQLYSGGHMKAFSVGWITHEYKMQEYELAPGVKKTIRVFTEVELIEISAVAIPANRESLVRAASALAPAHAPGNVPGNAAGNASGKSGAQNDPADLADLMREIRELKQIVHNGYSAEPGGALHMLILDIVEQAQAAGHGDRDDVPPETGAGGPAHSGGGAQTVRIESTLAQIQRELKAR